MRFLLDYVFPITVITPTQQASTAFLKQVMLLVAPKMGVDPDEIHECTSMSQVSALTDNVDAQQLFNAGMAKVFILPTNDLDIAAVLDEEPGQVFTILVSSDFDKDDVEHTEATGAATVTSYANLIDGTADTFTIEGEVFTAQAGAVVAGENTFRAATSNELTAASLAAQINAHEDINQLVLATVVGAVVTITAIEEGYSGNDIDVSYAQLGSGVGITLAGLSGGKLSGGAGLFVGTFDGVIGVWSTDNSWLDDQAAIANRSAFFANVTNKAKNMAYAFGKLLSNQLNWKNQQYISMPFGDGIANLGDSNSEFDDRISFVASDDEFSHRLAFFAQGGKAIVAPYIIKNLQIDMQSAALTFISGNQPDYTLTNAALLENQLQKVLDSYIARRWLAGGTVEVKLENSNFVASGYMEVPEPKALWKIAGELTQTT